MSIPLQQAVSAAQAELQSIPLLVPPLPPPPPPPPVPVVVPHVPDEQTACQLQLPVGSEQLPLAFLPLTLPEQLPDGPLNEIPVSVTEPVAVSPLGVHETVMLQPFWTMVQALSRHVPDSIQLPSTFAHVPVPPPLPPELQASASADKNPTTNTHFAIRMSDPYQLSWRPPRVRPSTSELCQGQEDQANAG